MLFRSPADISAGLDRHRGGRGPQRGSETLRNGFAHSTTPVRLADPPYSDRLRDSVTKARLNPLWQPMQVILEQHMAEQTSSRDVEEDPGLQSFVLLITILVAFLETAARLLSPIRPSLSLSFEEGINRTP